MSREFKSSLGNIMKHCQRAMGREGKSQRGDLSSSSEADYHQDREASMKGDDRSDYKNEAGCTAAVSGKRYFQGWLCCAALKCA